MTRLASGASTDVGQVRNVNQDAAFISADLAAVADGMGGHQAGEVASSMALSTLAESVDVDTQDGLAEVVLQANRVIYERAAEDADLRGMGTTLCAVALTSGDDGEEEVCVVNVGDSRVYCLEDGDHLVQLTEDHSLVQDLVREGSLDPDEAENHPQRNILTRALGIDLGVEVDTWVRPAVVGQRYLLCSDGLYNEVRHDKIAATMRNLADPTETAHELVRLANAGGGRDNITCVIVDVLDNDPNALAPEPVILATNNEPSASAPADPDLTLGLATPSSGRPQGSPSASASTGARAPRRFTWRVGVFLIALLALAIAVFGSVRFFATNSYFLGVDEGEVVIFQGRPDGVLWFDPSVSERTGISTDELTEAQLEMLAQSPVGDRDEADLAVSNLRDRAAENEEAVRAARSASTTSTRPGRPTTAADPAPTTTDSTTTTDP